MSCLLLCSLPAALIIELPSQARSLLNHQHESAESLLNLMFDCYYSAYVILKFGHFDYQIQILLTLCYKLLMTVA